MPVIVIPTGEINDWETFHTVFQRELGFPEFYGRNMDAWIDCLLSVDEPDGGMVADKVIVSDNDVLTLELDDASRFASRCPEQYAAVLECAASVNWSRNNMMGRRSIIALSFSVDR